MKKYEMKIGSDYMDKIINSFKYAISGIINSFKTERNMKIHIFITILVILTGFLLKITKIEWIICIFAIVIVLSAELFNTSIETIVDMITKERSENAKKAKDISAGAVFITAMGAAGIGLIIFIPKVMQLFR